MTFLAVRGRHAETKITGTAYGGCENNERPRFNVLGLMLLSRGCSPIHLGGSSPVSWYRLYHARHASTAWERFANTWSSICESIQSIRGCPTVTLIRGLYSAIASHTISSNVLNTFESDVYRISFNEIGASTYENKADSGRYGRLAESRIEEGY